MGLVAFFFFVYVLAGGKIDTAIPSPSKIGGFGDGVSQNPLGLMRAESHTVSNEVLGIESTEARAARQGALHSRGRIFDQDERKSLEEQDIDHSRLVDGSASMKPSRKEQKAIDRSTRKEVDPLLAIEERLNRLGK